MHRWFSTMSVLGALSGLLMGWGTMWKWYNEEYFSGKGGICHRLKKVTKKKACSKHCISHFSSMSFLFSCYNILIRIVNMKKRQSWGVQQLENIRECSDTDTPPLAQLCPCPTMSWMCHNVEQFALAATVANIPIQCPPVMSDVWAYACNIAEQSPWSLLKSHLAFCVWLFCIASMSCKNPTLKLALRGEINVQVMQRSHLFAFLPRFSKSKKWTGWGGPGRAWGRALRTP